MDEIYYLSQTLMRKSDNTISTLKQLIESQKMQIRNLTEDQWELRQYLEEVDKQNKQLESAKEDIVHRFSTRQIEHETRVKNIVNQYNFELDELKETNKTLAKNLQTRNKLLVQTNLEISGMKNINLELSERLSELSAKHEALNGHVQNLTDKIEELNNTINVRESKIIKLQSELNNERTANEDYKRGLDIYSDMLYEATTIEELREWVERRGNP